MLPEFISVLTWIMSESNIYRDSIITTLVKETLCKGKVLPNRVQD